MAVENIFRITADLKHAVKAPKPVVTQADDVRFEVDITDGGKKWSPQDYTNLSRASLASTRRDGQVVVTDGEIGKKSISFRLGKNAIELPGEVAAAIQLYSGSSSRVTTIKFTFEVAEDPTGEGYVPSTDEMTFIESVMSDAQAKIDELSQVDVVQLTGEVTTARGGKASLDARLNDVDAQMAQTETEVSNLQTNKINRGESISVGQIDKNSGKFDQTYMSDEFLQQITGNTPVNAVPPDGGVTPVKLSFELVEDVYLRYADVEATTVGTSINVKFTGDGQRIYWYIPNKGYLSHTLQTKEYTLEHNEYLALDLIGKTIVKKNITVGNMSANEKMLLLNIDGKPVAGQLKKHVDKNSTIKLIDDTNARIDGINIPTEKQQLGSKGEFKFKFQTNMLPSYMSSHCMVGEELWIFPVSNDENTNTANVQRHLIDFENKTQTLAGTFTHNWGHVNSISYNPITNALILGNGSGSYSLPGKLLIFENANDFANRSNVDVSEAISIDISSFGTKANVIWGDHNNGKGNICYVITNDNKNIRKLLLGQGTTQLENGSLLAGKTGLQYNGTYKILAEYSQASGDDVCQGACYVGGNLYIGLGHNVLWYSENKLHEDGTISKKIVKETFYNNDGTVWNKTVQGITVTDNHILVGLMDNTYNEIFVYAK